MEMPRRMLNRRLFLGSAAALALVPWLPGRISAAVPGAGDAAPSDILGELSYFMTRPETILLEVAREHDVGILEVSAVNPGIDPWVPEPERLILLPTAHILPDAPREGIIINKAELRLYYLPKDGPPQTHAIGIGRDGHDTPDGQTTIARKKVNPTWYPTAATRQDRPELPGVVGPGPDNPLGHRALYLGWPMYLIHGTNKPYGVGRRVSRGCVRMYPEAVEHLFETVPTGTRVTVVDQQVKVGWHEGDLWIEVHPGSGQLDELEQSYSFTPILQPELRAEAERLIGEKAGDSMARVDWEVVEAELVARRGIPVPISQNSRGTIRRPAVSRSVSHSAPARSAGGPARPLGLY
jgi:L,D-transpeptidase ErfK/SrfK